MNSLPVRNKVLYLMGPVAGLCVLVGWLNFRHYTLPDQVGRPVKGGQEL